MTWVLDTALVPQLTVHLLHHGRVFRRKEAILDVALQAVLELSHAKDAEQDLSFLQLGFNICS